MRISVIGIGRVGLPLALAFASKGVQVIGMDINEKYLQILRSKKMPFMEEGAEEILVKELGKNFTVTSNLADAMVSENIILTLGTPVDEHMNPDFSQIDSVLEKMLPYLRKGHLIILRSTVSPGTIDYITAYIEENSPFKVGKDIFLAFCPERLAEGKAIKELFSLPEIVGANDNKSKERAVEIFKRIKKEIYTTTAINAELLKLFTNMYRYINFAIANEFMIIAEQFGADIYQIVELSNKNYPRGGPKNPGLTAGPCLFKDGFFLTSKIAFPELIAAAWKINETIPSYLVERIKDFTTIRGKKVALLGLTFKADSDDTRESLSFKLIKILKRERAKVVLHDPFVKNDESIDSVISGADVLIIATAHSQYSKLGFQYFKSKIKPNCIIADIWNMFGKSSIVYQCPVG
ncbi:MAG: nucleotide sugar dehydrogenase [Candidatus Anstonellales archaeon]